jgi:hypothetical protein
MRFYEFAVLLKINWRIFAIHNPTEQDSTNIAELMGKHFFLFSLSFLVDRKVLSCIFPLMALRDQPMAMNHLSWQPNWRLTLHCRLGNTGYEPGTVEQQSGDTAKGRSSEVGNRAFACTVAKQKAERGGKEK